MPNRVSRTALSRLRGVRAERVPRHARSRDEGDPAVPRDMWRQGPGGGHYDEMASTKWTSVACGTYTLPDGSFWSVQNFK